jgi:hypothetical protein
MSFSDAVANFKAAAADYQNAYQNFVAKREEKDDFERGIRKHAYPNLIKQSNTQKMQLEFEHAVAQNGENDKYYRKLLSDFNEAELKLEIAKISYNMWSEIVRASSGYRVMIPDDNLE